MEYLVVIILYWVACFFRRLYLGKGQKVYFFILLRLLKLLNPQPAETINLSENKAGKALQKKLYLLTPNVYQRLIKNFIWAKFIGKFRREKFREKRLAVPLMLFISPTYRCNLNCDGCYAKGHKGELPQELLENILTEQEKLGIFNVFLTGGEPFIREDLWLIFAKYPRTTFIVYTNGTLLSKENIKRISQLGNIILMISLEGFQKTTDKRRGNGIYKKVINLLQLCQQANIFYNVSVTVAQENLKEVTSKKFIKKMVNLGVFAINYLLFVLFTNNDSFSALSERQTEKLRLWSHRVKDRYPIFPIINKNGSKIVNNCVAADRRIHITANGDVEPCVFCHWASDNIKEKSILEVMNSEFFRMVRGLNTLHDTKLNPCKVSNSELLLNLFRTSGAELTK